MESKFNNSELTVNEIIEIASRAAADVAIKKLEEKKKKANEEQRDRRLKNARLLLRNYKALKIHSENAIYEENQDVSISEYSNPLEYLLVLEAADEATYVQSIKESVKKTKIIIQHVDRMLELFRTYCNSSGLPEEKRRYKVIHHKYLAERTKTDEQIAKILNIHVRTVYKDKKIAEERISSLLFGIDGFN